MFLFTNCKKRYIKKLGMDSNIECEALDLVINFYVPRSLQIEDGKDWFRDGGVKGLDLETTWGWWWRNI